MAADKGKKQKTEEVEEGNNGAQIDGELVLSIEKLQEIQDELEKINEEASEKVLEVEQKYNEIRKPAYDKRNDIIKSIPDFWLTAFMSHPALSELLTEEDQKIFKYLNNLEVEDFKDVKSGYSITFIFSPNPYFEDTKLTKTFTFLEEGITKINATSIKWKEGMGIPNGIAEEKKGKRSHAEERLPSSMQRIELSKLIYVNSFSDMNMGVIHRFLTSIQLNAASFPGLMTQSIKEADEEELEMDDDDDDEISVLSLDESEFYDKDNSF
ncbi:hypothetical protein DH2020_043022 [Rehmannia glutinosa]|uniref:Uncharacterized protein n=1 Tax=Rehmannia glutinosa TaxID=99300 RepID=A0ABR0ULA1_REHGL